MKNECRLTEVSCPFAYAGCAVKLPRKDMPGHTADISVHFPLLVSYIREIEQKQKAMEKRFEEKLKTEEKKLREAKEQHEAERNALMQQLHHLQRAKKKH